MWHWTRNWDAHHRLIAALAVAVVAGVVSYEYWPRAALWVSVWDAFAFTLIVLSWVQIATSNQKRMMAAAKAQDFSNLVMFVFILIACFMSLFAVGYLLGSERPENRPLELLHLFISIVTVGCSWLLIHTLFALHYAHLCHRTQDGTSWGVLIPEEETPDYFDFAYLSLSIGTGFQPGDFRVTSRQIRRLMMLHGFIAFIFNTAIVALAVGCVSTLVIR